MNGITSARTKNQALTFNERQPEEAEHARRGWLESEMKTWQCLAARRRARQPLAQDLAPSLPWG